MHAGACSLLCLRGMLLRFLSCVALAAVVVAIVCLPATAHAETVGRLQVDWSKLVDALREGAHAFDHEGGFHLGEEERPAPPRSSSASNEDMPWVGSSPHLALIARDWGGAQRLVGALSLMDRLRPIRSSRMLVTRVRITDGRVMPFVQLGLGQWRIDTDLLPTLPRDVEMAGQLGGGVEIALGPRAALAIEADETMLYREHHEAQMVCDPHVWNSLLAARVEF
jgi:hypothetical protein